VVGSEILGEFKGPSILVDGHLRSGEMGWKCGEIPREQLVDAVDGMIDDASEHMAQIKFLI
jgi:hypothetical protein